MPFIKIINKKIYSLIFLVILLFSSCREDIIPPNTPISNLNEPIRLLSNDSYTFMLNADNVTTTYRDYAGLNGNLSIIHISLANYKSGTIIFHIYNNSDQLIFQKAMSDNVDGFSEYLTNVRPSIVHIIFNNFTGNLKIKIDNLQ